MWHDIDVQDLCINHYIMKRYIFSIAEPCTASWAEMTPLEQGRYCLQCEKKVVDFSGMSDAEVVRYFEKHDNVCGRFTSLQLNREMYIPGKRSVMPAAMLAGALSLLAPQSGQAQTQTQQITGVVRDVDTREPVPGVTVMWSTTKGTVTKSDGSFSLDVPKDSLAGLKLMFKSVGYKIQELDYVPGQEMQVAMCEEVMGRMDVVVVKHPKKKKKRSKE